MCVYKMPIIENYELCQGLQGLLRVESGDRPTLIPIILLTKQVMWLIVPWFCLFSLFHQHTPTALLSSAFFSLFPGLGPLTQLPSHLHHLPPVQGLLPTVHWAFHTGVSRDRAPLEFSKNAEVKINALPPQCCRESERAISIGRRREKACFWVRMWVPIHHFVFAI